MFVSDLINLATKANSELIAASQWINYLNTKPTRNRYASIQALRESMHLLNSCVDFTSIEHKWAFSLIQRSGELSWLP